MGYPAGAVNDSRAPYNFTEPALETISFEACYLDSRDVEHPVEITFKTYRDRDDCSDKVIVVNYWYEFLATTSRDTKEAICRGIRECIRVHLDDKCEIL